LVIKPDRPESDHVDGAIDASINARLTQHLMDNAARPAEVEFQDSRREGLRSRILTATGLAFLMSVLGLYSYFDRKQRVL
jgi:hypothetical protein